MLNYVYQGYFQLADTKFSLVTVRLEKGSKQKEK